MANNSDEEHLENSTNNQSEIPSGVITPTEDIETINSNQVTENMEVHHHTHDPAAAPHHKKNWKSYFWEFLMLFLAVFCGFLAEYQLEHTIEKERANELAKSFYAELKLNDDACKKAIFESNRKDTAIQYIKHYFRDSSLQHFSKEFSVNFGVALLVNRPVIFEPRSAILNLLINSGSLRYFKSKSLQQMTIDLSIAIKEIEARNARANQYISDNIDPFIMDHQDDEWMDKVSELNRGITSFVVYQKSNYLFPFQLKNAEKIDKVRDINRISLYAYIIKVNANLFYKKCDALNSKLLNELQKEYQLN